MSDHEPADSTDVSAIDSLTDPERVADREGVDRCIHEATHESEDHCEAGYEGRAIVGVVDDEGELLLCVHEQPEALVLPNAKVEPGADWVAEARRAAAEAAGIDVAVEAVERVRQVDHVVEGEATTFQTTRHVVFRATPVARDAVRAANEEGATVDWFDALPDGFGDCGDPAVADARLFLG